MKTSSRWNVRDMAGRIMLGIVVTLMIGSVHVTPAFSREYDTRGNQGRYEHRGRGHDQVRYEHRRNYRDRRGYDRRWHRERGYDYDGPPGFFIPPPPPGVSIFFPPVIIQP
jgi:hypothetical protein